jgi:Uncharacterised protein family (UPF0158)
VSAPLRRLAIDMNDLELAWESHAIDPQDAFLDLETGAVALIPGEVSSEVERLEEELGEDAAPEAFAAASRLPDWERDLLRDKLRVEEGFGTRFIRIPQEETRDAYHDMEDFIETVRDGQLQERLSDAIRGRGAFRRFNDVLARHDAERERWFAFRAERVRQRICDWLAEEGVAPEDRSHMEAR